MSMKKKQQHTKKNRMTPEERKAQYNREYYHKVYKKKRVSRYKTDEDYREEKKQARIDYYRGKVGAEAKFSGAWQGTLPTRRHYLCQGGSVYDRTKTKCASIADLADALDMNYHTVNGWVNSGIFPAPSHRTWAGSYVYTVPEAKALIRALYKGLQGKSNFRQSDTETIALLKEAI